MGWLEAILLCLVQGLTELLPVSSSGHLRVAELLLGSRGDGVLFEIVVQLGILLAILLFFQGAYNIGVNLNIVPVSGLPLPFFSYGGSSLLTSLLGIGLVQSVILRHKQIEL